jgi:hypothetical protein
MTDDWMQWDGTGAWNGITAWKSGALGNHVIALGCGVTAGEQGRLVDVEIIQLSLEVSCIFNTVETNLSCVNISAPKLGLKNFPT